GDVLRYGDVVRHAGSLLRNDRGLLVAVSAAASELLATFEDPSNGKRLNSLVDLGATRDLDPKELSEKLRATAPKPADVLEAELDEIYERLGTLSAATPRSVGEPKGAAKVIAAVSLLSSVVTSSELV